MAEVVGDSTLDLPPSSIARLAAIPIHPALFAIYPVLYVLSENVGRMPPGESVRAFIAALAYSVLLFGPALILARNARKAGAIVSFVIGLTFTYDYFDESAVQTAAVIAGGVIFIGSIIAYRGALRRPTQFLNLFAVALLAVAAVNLAQGWDSSANHQAGFIHPDPDMLGRWHESPPQPPSFDETPPDIYYIIVDAYARQDVLANRYNYDNSYFIDFLREQGFYVGDRARSNYARTLFSLASTLNYSHLPEFVERNGLATSDNSLIFHRLVFNNRVIALLKQGGYEVHSIRGPYAIHGMVINADVTHSSGQLLNEFEYLVVGPTPFPQIVNRIARFNGYRRHYDAMRNVLDTLEQAPDFTSPKFVMAHLFAPHPPFVFGRDGQFVQPSDPVFTMSDGEDIIGPYLPPDDYIRGFADQTHWVNHRIMEVVTRIRKRNPDAVVIIQSDHGPRSHSLIDGELRSSLEERFAILNAVYLPGMDTSQLPPDLTSINTFPLVFNVALGLRLPALDQTSYYSQPPFLSLFLPVRYTENGAVLSVTPEQQLLLETAGQ